MVELTEKSKPCELRVGLLRHFGAIEIKQSRGMADLSLLMVALIWGSTYVASKDVVATVAVLPFIFLRFSVTTAVMLPWTWRDLRRAHRKTWKIGGVFGLFLLVIFSAETFGIAHTSAADAGFIISLFAIFVPLMESLIYRRRPALRVVGAASFALVGTAFLTMKGNRLEFNIGDLLVLGAAVFRALQMILTKHLTAGEKMNSSVLTTIQLAVVSVGSGIACLINGSSFSHLTMSFWIITGYLAIFATMWAFFVQMTMIRRTSPARVAILMSSEPVFAAIFSIIFLHEHLSFMATMGGLLIVAGILWGRRVA